MEVGKIGLPRIVVDSLPSYEHSYSIRVILQYHNALTGTELGRQLMQKLRANRCVEALEGTMVKCGPRATSFHLDQLAAWWLWRANEVGEEQADADLNVFLSSEHSDVLGVLWVYGIKPEMAQPLTEDVALVPVEEMPDSDDKEYILKSVLRPCVHPGVEVLPTAALVKRYRTTKILRSPEEILEPDKGAAARTRPEFEVQTHLHKVGLLLNCLPGVCCTSAYSTSYSPPEVPLGPFGGGGGGKSVRDVVPLRVSALEQGHEATLSELVDKYQHLPERLTRRLERAMLRFAQAKGRFDLHDKALDLGIALEMLLLNTEHNRNELPGQLHLHFRLRGAWLIGTTTAERQDLFRVFSKIYSWRSQVAHNGICDELITTEANTHDEIENKMEEHIAVAERIFQALIMRGTPNWQALVLGEEDES